MSIEIHEDAGARLKLAMQERRLKASDLASALDVSEASAYRIMAGKGGLSARALAQIAIELRISPTWVVLGTGQMFLDVSEEAGQALEALEHRPQSRDISFLTSELARIAMEIRALPAGHHGPLHDLLAKVTLSRPGIEVSLRGMLEMLLLIPEEKS